MKKIISIVLLTALLLSLISSAMAYSYSDNYPEYYIYSTMPKGYCYLYDQPSDINGSNLGQLKNGKKVKKIFWSEANDGNRNNGYCFVICPNGKTGYVHDYVLKSEYPSSSSSSSSSSSNSYSSYTPTPQWYGYIYSYNPYGYCYLYDQPSDINGTNLGRHENGERVGVISWSEANDGNRNNGYYYVICRNGKVGYIHDYVVDSDPGD